MGPAPRTGPTGRPSKGAAEYYYTAEPEDARNYVRATVAYTDGLGDDVTLEAVTDEVVDGSDNAPELAVTEHVTGLSIPWDIAFTPDNTMLYTERAGVLSARLSDGTVWAVTADVEDLEIQEEVGLMAMVVDPSFSSNRRFYTCQGHTGSEVQVIAWTINDAYDTATRVADPLIGGIPTEGGAHAGCRMRFGPDGYLWIATGDGARYGSDSQDLSTLGGKVLRVDASTGAGAPGNPFPLSPLIYTYGHRNPQGLALRPGTRQMWLVEHGPTIDDEINLLTVGGNYGWDPSPVRGQVGYTEDFRPMTDRLRYPGAIEAEWSSGSRPLATSGGIFLEGADWGDWEGWLAVASLRDSTLRVFEFAADGHLLSEVVVSDLDGTYGRLRTPMLGPDRALYVSTSNGGGADKILRVAPCQARRTGSWGSHQSCETAGRRQRRRQRRRWRRRRRRWRWRRRPRRRRVERCGAVGFRRCRPEQRARWGHRRPVRSRNHQGLLNSATPLLPQPGRHTRPDGQPVDPRPATPIERPSTRALQLPAPGVKLHGPGRRLAFPRWDAQALGASGGVYESVDARAAERWPLSASISSLRSASGRDRTTDAALGIEIGPIPVHGRISSVTLGPLMIPTPSPASMAL